VRRARNAGDHRGEDKPQSADDVRADLPDCRRIVDIAANTSAAPDAVRLTMPAPSLATRGRGRR